jgi:hypothetical protein
LSIIPIRNAHIRCLTHTKTGMKKQAAVLSRLFYYRTCNIVCLLAFPPGVVIA